MCHGFKTKMFVMEGRMSVANNDVLIEKQNIENNYDVKILPYEGFYECEKCGKKFDRKYNLEIHHKKKFNCNNDPKLHIDSSVHEEIIFSNKKIHQCLGCLKIFSRNDVLQNHIKNHCKGLEIQKTKCDYCFRIFFETS